MPSSSETSPVDVPAPMAKPSGGDSWSSDADERSCIDEDYPKADNLIRNMAVVIACFLTISILVNYFLDLFAV